MNLATAVRSQRAAQRKSQESLGAQIGVSRQSIMSIENGGGTSFEIAKKLSLVLGFSLDALTLP